METDAIALIEKLKKAVEYRTKMEFATALVFNETNAASLVGADNRVESAQATLIAFINSTQRRQG